MKLFNTLSWRAGFAVQLYVFLLDTTADLLSDYKCKKPLSLPWLPLPPRWNLLACRLLCICILTSCLKNKLIIIGCNLCILMFTRFNWALVLIKTIQWLLSLFNNLECSRMVLSSCLPSEVSLLWYRMWKSWINNSCPPLFLCQLPWRKLY